MLNIFLNMARASMRCIFNLTCPGCWCLTQERLFRHTKAPSCILIVIQHLVGNHAHCQSAGTLPPLNWAALNALDHDRRHLFASASVGSRVELVHRRRLELARADAILKQHVELAIGATLGLGKAEVGPQGTGEAGPGPEEPGLGAPVPGRRVEHARGDDVGGDADDVVHVAGQHDRLGAQACRGELRHEGVADWADGGVVGKGVDEEHRANGPLCRHVLAAGKRSTADNQQHAAHEQLAREVQGPSAKPAHEEPGRHGPDRAESILAEGHAERVIDRHAGLLVKVRRVTHKGRATERLDHPRHAHNLGAAKVDALEQGQVRGARFNLPLHLVCVHHHRHRLVGLEVDTGVAGRQAD
ncbi:hypothetical protein TOPH_02779 [Tolypocladium ophioglossoides CBS 100239]|uniref:Uncharacterized protein n=1 Tax=Tolypocladium ophioglossoides (strain CBS 100239) TaxID=1163406 RepID=A0A0L0NEE1_TOLOC|nr:hypothetical protein TOPH_02779 [Tolypocladium ophioglossoides CBS 100239]